MESVDKKPNYMSLSDFDVYLFHEGTLYESYKTMGAHCIVHEGEKGIRFAVWAPNAESVAVAGDFNDWEASRHKMVRIPYSGIWVLFVPELEEGALYKYEIRTPAGETFLKCDPYAFQSEKRPKTASVVRDLERYEWNDQTWLKSKAKKDPYHEPMLVYEMHLGSWKKKKDGTFYSYRELANELIDYVADLGYTHIELMPIMEHPYDRSWGYQITGYYSVTSRYGSPEDFMYFVDCCHQKSIGVILDWVPLHFCKDAHGLANFDGSSLFEPSDERLAERPNWGTRNFDLAKPEVVSFLLSNAMFWLDVYHVDGFRIDAVSSMIYLNHDNANVVPLRNEQGGHENLEAIAFLKKLNEVVFASHPNVLMMAEEATDWPLVSAPTDQGGLGFNYKWNMGWANDVLRYMQLDFPDRPSHHNLLTFSFFYAFSENFILPFSHDELVYGKRSLLNKMPGDYWRKFANLRVLYGYFMTHPGKKLIFMGSEFAQFDEWKDETELDWNLFEFPAHRKFYDFLNALNAFYRDTRCLWRLDHEPEGFEWIDPHNQNQSVITFLRKGKRKGDSCIVVCNFSAEVYHNYRIGVPSPGKYVEMFNSDGECFGGSGQMNARPLTVERKPHHDRPYSLEINVPPLAVTIFMKQTKKRRRGMMEWKGKNASPCCWPAVKDQDLDN